MLSSQQAHREYANRPADEQFPSLQALVDFSREEKRLSAEKTYNLKDLHAVVVPTVAVGLDGEPHETDKSTVMLASPKGQARFTHWSFGQLSRILGAPANYLRQLPPALAADGINHGLANSVSGSAVNLLVRAANGQPEPVIRSATSETYGRLWNADFYGAVQDTIVGHDDKWTPPPTWTGEPAGVSSGDRDSFVILTHGGSIVTDPSINMSLGGGGQAVSGAMYRGILLRNSEVGAAAVAIETILFRYVCGNHMLWGAVIDKAFKRRHVGAHTLRDTVREVSRIAFNWSNSSAARDEAIIKTLIDHEIAHTKEAVIDELRAMGASKEHAESAYALCERTESVSPRSFWGMVQGLTRRSQETVYQDDRYAIDRMAAAVLARGAKMVIA
jgi:hypothetical protein